MAADIACIYDPAVFNAIQKASRNERDEKSDNGRGRLDKR